MTHTTLRALPLTLVALSLSATAQNLPPVDATYHIGRISHEPLSSCGPGQGLAFSNYGTLVLTASGTFTIQGTEAELCESGATQSGPFADGGDYTITEDGALTLDFDPGNPGVDVIPLQLSWDQELFLSTFIDPFEQSLMVGVRAATAASTSLLAGEYAIAGQSIESAAGGFGAGSVLGDLTFDGAGAWSGTFSEHILEPGQPRSSGVGLDNGPYSVFPNGSMSTYLAGLPDGATSRDGRFGFIVNEPTDTPELSLFLRKPDAGNAVTPSALEDDWWLSTFGADQAGGLGKVTPTVTKGLATLDPVGGTLTYTGGPGGTFSSTPSGQVNLAWSAGGDSGWLARSEDVALFSSQGAASYTGIGVLLRDWSPLQRNKQSLSLSGGGSQVLEVRATNDHAGRWYFIAGSSSGFAPGTPFGGGLMPLNIDGYTLLSVTNANLAPFINTAGLLSVDGKALAAFVIPAGLSPGLAGATLHHAAVVLDVTSPTPFVTATNAASVTFAP